MTALILPLFKHQQAHISNSEADLGYEIKFSVSFTDDDGFVEQSNVYGFTGSIVEPMPNIDATWSNPSLTPGDHYVTRELKASLNFADPNGSTNASAILSGIGPIKVALPKYSVAPAIRIRSQQTMWV